MPNPYVVPTPYSTAYEYAGDVPALDGVHLTKLAKSYAELDKNPSLADIFPEEYSPERSIVIETIQENLGITPPVMPSVPNGDYLPNDKLFRRIVEPILFRENTFVDNYVINQMRTPGTYNEVYSPERYIQERVRKMVVRRNRMLDLMRIQTLLGGIDFDDPRTNVHPNVSTQIPAHNFVRYDGYDGTLASGGTLSAFGTTYTANKALTQTSSRKEAVYFTSLDEQFAIPWTHPNANIARCLRYIKQYYRKANKNVLTDMYLSSDLYTILLENNQIKAENRQVAYVNYANTQGKQIEATSANGGNALLQVDAGGDFTSLCGLRVNIMDQIYSDPRDNQVKNMWPNNKVVLLSRSHVNDRSQTVGRTQFCVGEGPNQAIGLWSVTNYQHTVPNLMGTAIQMGDAFLPYAMYPQWIMVLDVCDANTIESSTFFDSELAYGTF